MADDNLLRSYRTNNPATRSAEPRDSTTASDPLAELARLIGQTDPFGEAARGQHAAQPPMTHDAPPVAGDWRQHIERPSYHEPARPIADLPPDPYAAHPHADHGHDAFSAAGHADDHRLHHSDEPYRSDAGYAATMQPHAVAAYHPDEQTYDDPPGQQSSGSRSGTLAFAGVLVCCALIGGASAYGYRTLGGKSSPGTTPAPVIVADKSPSKIVPAAAEQKSRTQERFVVQGAERLVSREEQPAPLPGSSSRVAALPEAPLASPAAPIQTMPAASGPTATGTTPPAASVVSPPPTPADALTEPKRVRTVPIRPEGGDTSARPQSRANQNAKAAPPAQRVQAGPPAARGAPLSLDPGAAQTSEPARSQQRPLTPPAPRDSAPAGERVASAPSNGNAAGYLVQVSSQRSESDARASYRGLQQKYPQLKSRQPIIRRASLGDKGTYYRAMIGPFGSSGEAEKFCGGLKSAGGQCLIVRN